MDDEEGNSSLWVRTSHESCDRPAFRWIKSWKRLESDIPGTTLSRKSRRGRSRERRRTSFVRESWRITRNREPFHSCFFFFFPLSLSIERLFVQPFLSSPRSVRISSFIETQQVELGWFSKKLAEFIKPAHPVFIARPNLFPTWIIPFSSSGKRSCSKLFRVAGTLIVSSLEEGIQVRCFWKKNDDYNEIDRQSLDRAIGKNNRSSPLPSIELPSMFICSTSASDGSLLFPFSFFFFYEFLL